MSGGDIAGLISAGVFAVLVGLLAIPLVKLGRVFDEAGTAIRDLGTNVTPLLEEATTTISETNKQLARVDTITRGVAEATGNVASLVALTAATVGGARRAPCATGTDASSQSKSRSMALAPSNTTRMVLKTT